MAIIKCPECGKEISDKAASCPDCGFPMEKREQVKAEKKLDNIKLNNKTMVSIASAVVALAIGLVVLLNSPSGSSKLIPFGLKLKMSFNEVDKIMENSGFLRNGDVVKYENGIAANYSGKKEAFGMESNAVSIDIYDERLRIDIHYPSGAEETLLNNLVSQFGDAAANLYDDKLWIWIDNNTSLMLFCPPNENPEIYYDEYKNAAETKKMLNDMKTASEEYAMTTSKDAEYATEAIEETVSDAEYATEATEETAVTVEEAVAEASYATYADGSPVEEEYISEDFYYSILEDDTIEITRLRGEEYDLIIPETIDGKVVTSIDYLDGYANFRTLTIPDTINHIGANPFRSGNLEQIIVSPDHPYLSVIDGVLFSKPDKRLICYPSRDPAKEYSIPDGIVTVEEDAFFYAENLKSVIIPKSVQNINSNPFYSCKHLEQFVLSPDNPYLEIVEGVLYSKVGKRLIASPALNKIRGPEFIIPNGTEIIGDYAFYRDSFFSAIYLSHIILPESVTTIGDHAFSGTTISRISLPAGLKTIGNYAFSDCKGLDEITIPGSVATITHTSFKGCKQLTKVNILNGVERIGDSAFYGCSMLQEITIPNSVTEIERFAFTDCKNLSSIVLPKSLAEIPLCMLKGCHSLSIVSIPEGLSTIDAYAFSDCTSLKGIAIPNSVVSIKNNAFEGCKNITFTVGRNSYAKEYCTTNGFIYNYPDSQDWLNAPPSNSDTI